MDRGVFYPQSGPGEPWNGLISVEETPSVPENDPSYIDGVKLIPKKPRGDFSGNISTFGHPLSFYDDILSQTRAKPFGMSYRVMTPTGYKLHLVYNVLLGPSGFVYSQQDADSYSWGFTSLPIDIPESWYGASKTAHLIIDGNVAYSSTVSAVEDALYGTESTDPFLPTPQEIFQIFENNSILQIIDNGDGTWTAIGPASAITMLDAITFQIDWPSAVFIDANSYTIHSL